MLNKKAGHPRFVEESGFFVLVMLTRRNIVVGPQGNGSQITFLRFYMLIRSPYACSPSPNSKPNGNIANARAAPTPKTYDRGHSRERRGESEGLPFEDAGSAKQVSN